jgi:hypothetical protein
MRCRLRGMGGRTLSAIEPLVKDVRIEPHQTIEATDGDYDFDVTMRFEFIGLSHLTIVEAKKHKNPIKRELVQVLHQKLVSAIKFAMAHGIALLVVAEGRFTYIARGYRPLPGLRHRGIWRLSNITPAPV